MNDMTGMQTDLHAKSGTNQGRLSRRHFLAGATAAAGAAILAACGGTSSATDTPKPATGATSAPASAPTTAAAATAAPATSGSAAAPTTAAAAAPTTAAAAGGKGKALKMARNAEPQSVLIPWQADDNPSLFVLVNIYDTLLRTT
ncbi:MAG: twin-arginine translocation signal domain-containing protein, partial [Chloroflexota bacterium]|nr:twin-arginine translocation signal domain-containing protein [Chloroflexota bacterium]